MMISYSGPNVEDYRWINLVTVDEKPPLVNDGSTIQTPYLDPPPGGWSYGDSDNSPFYWDDKDFNSNSVYNISNNRTQNTLKFTDCPKDPYLTADKYIEFNTCIINIHTAGPEQCIQWQLKPLNRIKVIGRVLIPIDMFKGILPK